MARPTEAEIRRILNDLGLPQVDPNSWFKGTLPELLRVNLNAGNVVRVFDRTDFINVQFTSAANTDQKFAVFTAAADEIAFVRYMFIEFVSSNIARIRLQMQNGFTINQLWQDEPSPPFSGPYIGTDLTATQAWGAQGLNNIRVVGLQANPNNVNQLLEIRVESSGSVVKVFDVNAQVEIYKLIQYPGF